MIFSKNLMIDDYSKPLIDRKKRKKKEEKKAGKFFLPEPVKLYMNW